MKQFFFILYISIALATVYLSLKRSSSFLTALLISLLLHSRLSDDFNINISSFKISFDTILITLVFIINFFTLKFPKLEAIIFLTLFISALCGELISEFGTELNVLINGFIPFVLIYLISFNAAKNTTAINNIASTLQFLAFLTFFYGLFQPIVNSHLSDYFYIRVSSLFYNPTIFGSVGVLLWPFLFFYNKHIKSSVIKFITQIAGFLSIILSGSRGPISIVILQFAVIYIADIFYKGNFDYSLRKLYFKFLIQISAFLLFCFEFWDTISQILFRRFFDPGWLEYGSSGSERINGLFGAIEIFYDYPIFGVGLGNFKNAYILTLSNYRGFRALDHAHNFIANMLAEQGIFGVLWIILFIRYIYISICIGKKPYEIVPSKKRHAIIFSTSIIGFTINIILFGGELVHKMTGAPFLMYATVLAISYQLFCCTLIDTKISDKQPSR